METTQTSAGKETTAMENRLRQLREVSSLNLDMVRRLEALTDRVSGSIPSTAPDEVAVVHPEETDYMTKLQSLIMEFEAGNARFLSTLERLEQSL